MRIWPCSSLAALWRVGLESYVALYNLSPAISLAERASFGLRNSECLVALLTVEGSSSPEVCQEIGLARGLDLLIIPLLEEGAKLPFLIEHLRPLAFREERYADAVGLLIKTLRELSRLEWLKVSLSQMRGGDDPVSHAPGGGGGGAGEGHFFGDDLQLLPEQDPAGCEDV